MQPKELGWKPLVQSWLNKLALPGVETEASKQIREHILSLFEDYVAVGLKFLRESCKENVPSEDTNLVASLCSLFASMLTTEKGVNFGDESQLATIANPIFVFSYVWTIGGNVAQSSQDVFDEFARRLFDTLITIPPSGLVYDYYVNYEDRMLHSWDEQVPRFLYSREIPYFQMIVPTADTIRYTFILETLIRSNRPVLLNGLTGMCLK
jgi:dynein heavy chain